MIKLESKKNHFSLFALFSKSILVNKTCKLKLGRDIAWGEGTLSAILTSNDFDLGKWRPF